MSKGYLRVSQGYIDSGIYNFAKNIASECDELVIGIPGRRVYARLNCVDRDYDPNSLSDMWKSLPFVSDVVILGPEDLTLIASYNRIGFEKYYYGTEYGQQYLRDCDFAKSNGIKMISFSPEAFVHVGLPDSFSIALKNVQPDQKIILFGTGRYFDLYMERYADKYKPAYAVDNNQKLWGKYKDKVLIKNSESITKESPEKIIVILCAKDCENIKRQLAEHGEYDYRSLKFDRYISPMDELAISITQEQEYIKSVQAGLLNILKDFDELCRNISVDYYMICGSMIGTARHQGFIPWDDDLDVAMTRDDYNRFAKAFAEKYGNSNRYVLQDLCHHDKDVFTDCLFRMIDTSKLYPHKINKNVCKPENADIFRYAVIDIYVCDNAFDNEKKHNIQMNLLKIIYNMAMGHRNNVDYKSYYRLGRSKVVLMRFINRFGKLFTLSFIQKLYDRVSQWANGSDSENYFMSGCSITCIERKFKKVFFGKGSRMKFEDMMVEVPSDIDGLMEAMHYYNYMKLPPYSEWKPCHYFNSDKELW